MKQMQWWMRIVGGFYLLLTLMNLWGLFLNPAFFQQNLPPHFAADTLAVRAFSDAWMVFVFELGAIGLALLYGARNPAGNKILVLLVVLAELFRGVLADAIWIGRGYSAASYGVFIVIHLLIIVSGIWLVRRPDTGAAS